MMTSSRRLKITAGLLLVISLASVDAKLHMKSTHDKSMSEKSKQQEETHTHELQHDLQYIQDSSLFDNSHLQNMPVIIVDSNATPAPTPSHSDGKEVPVIPVPGNHSNITESPTLSPTDTPTMAPTNHTGNHTDPPKPVPTPSPTKKYHPPTDAPTKAPSPDDSHKKKKGGGFFRMVGKMFAWCILLGLSVLLYGFCMQHQYQILYYLRHCKQGLVATYYFLLAKVRGGNGGNYAPMSPYNGEHYDAQPVQSIFFDNPTSNNPFDTTYTGTYPDPANNDVMGQHSNTPFNQMG